ncbi:MAG TPA: biopolymer transporter ExbD [Steroidobacteraceae bacterium]|jgi:biopolymer transport protein ExbD|nr:biopolymer transporter ExbD [Steroidobacteraceae bacterium]
MNLKPRRPEEPEINVTSLIDVVLLLVVFFMLSSNFSAEGRLRIRLPQASEKAAERAAGEGLVVTVSASGAYLVNGRELINSSPDTLRAAILKSTADAARGAPVTIRADGRASHQAVVTAMDVLGRLGFTQMNVATLNETAAGSP